MRAENDEGEPLMALRPAIVALFFAAVVAAQDRWSPEWRAEQRAHRDKLAAIRSSVKAGETTHLPDLLAILAADTYPSIRQEVVDLLGGLRDPRVFVALHEALGREQGPSTRRRIVAALGACGDPRALPVLVGLLEDKKLRAESMVLLGELGDPRALPALLESLGDEKLRTYAAGVLGVLGDRRAYRDIERLWVSAPEDAELQRCGARALLQLNAPRALPLVLARLANDPRTAQPLARALEDRDEPEVRRAFLALLGSAERVQRNAAFDALLGIIPTRGGDDADAAALMGYWQRLEVRDADHRQWVAIVIGHTNSKAAAQWACVALEKEKDHATKARLLEALGRLGEPRAIATIAPFLYVRPKREATCSMRFAPENVALHYVAAWSIAMLRDGPYAGSEEWDPLSLPVADSEPIRAWWESQGDDPRWSFGR